MTEPSSVLETKYVVMSGMDFTEARVRVAGKDIWIRVGGLKTAENDSAFLIQEAEQQAGVSGRVNGS